MNFALFNRNASNGVRVRNASRREDARRWPARRTLGTYETRIDKKLSMLVPRTGSNGSNHRTTRLAILGRLSEWDGQEWPSYKMCHC